MTMPDPVGVSGPGAMSQRIDKQPMRDVTGLPYGDAGALRSQQQGAPMAAQPQVPTPSITPLHAPTARPDQPVTAGAAAGEGPGPDVLNQRAPGQPAGGVIAQAIARAAASDPTGELAQLLVVAQQKGL
jgi:hypothetical protein